MWFKVDDKLHDHEKVRRLDDLAAVGLWTMAGSWCGDNGTDGFVPSSVLRRWSSSWKRLAAKLVAVNLWTAADQRGEAGYRFVNWTSWQPTAAQAKDPTERRRWARAKALSRNRELCEAIVTRDRGRCRYCAVRVNFSDKRGRTGGTYDHVDPDGDNTLDNVVVACRKCNGEKKDRTPAEAGMPLLPEPSTESTPDLAGAKSGPDPDSSGDLALTHAPARDRTGQVGAGSGSGPGLAGSGPRSVPGYGPFDDDQPSSGRNDAA